MITNAIARRYAKALVQLASEEGKVDAFKEQLQGVESALAANADLRGILASPAYRIEAKREILRELLDRLSPAVTVRNFVMLLLDKNRLSQFPEVVSAFGSFADEVSGIIRPTLTSALPLDETQVASIRETLEKSTGKKVVLSVTVDAGLIGGIVTKIGDKVFDGSVRTQLERIEDTLQKG